MNLLEAYMHLKSSVSEDYQPKISEFPEDLSVNKPSDTFSLIKSEDPKKNWIVHNFKSKLRFAVKKGGKDKTVTVDDFVGTREEYDEFYRGKIYTTGYRSEYDVYYVNVNGFRTKEMSWDTQRYGKCEARAKWKKGCNVIWFRYNKKRDIWVVEFGSIGKIITLGIYKGQHFVKESSFL